MFRYRSNNISPFDCLVCFSFLCFLLALFGLCLCLVGISIVVFNNNHQMLSLSCSSSSSSTSFFFARFIIVVVVVVVAAVVIIVIIIIGLIININCQDWFSLNLMTICLNKNRQSKLAEIEKKNTNETEMEQNQRKAIENNLSIEISNYPLDCIYTSRPV